MIYPWQKNKWQQLIRAYTDGRFAHALLFSGMAGIGKAAFAEQLARFLLCRQSSSSADFLSDCHCRSCQLFSAGTHPNMRWVTSEKPGQALKVDQIRDLREFMSQTALFGEKRIAIINPAHQMNINAANALLKTLEEPAPGGIIILISDQSATLPATILSRCQQHIFSRPSREEALPWLCQQLNAEQNPALLLNLADGAPLKALSWGTDKTTLALRAVLLDSLSLLALQQVDPLTIAGKIEELSLLQLLDLLTTWLMDLLKLQLGIKSDRIINQDYHEPLLKLTQSKSLKHNLELMQYAQQLRKNLLQGLNLNKQLLIESLLIKWSQ